jgi:phospholipid/cholesterol/gamma-HCH transport system substrate-binding protein
MSKVARLGAFIVVTLAILVAGVFLVGSKQYLFRPTYQLKAQFDNVAGLMDGADVQVGGIHSGTVTDIEMPHKPGEKVTLVMNLDKSTHEIIKQDSVASIETEGALGNKFVAISFGSAGQAEVKSGDTIRSLTPLVMADMLKKASNVLDNSQEVTAHLNSISSKIDSGQGTVGALVNDKQLYSNLAQTTAALHETTIRAQAGVTNFQEDMEALKHNFLLRGYFRKRGYEDSGDLATNRIAALPQGTPMKTFTYASKELFDASDSAQLKNQKSLNAAGEFLAQNQFGLAVVVVSVGMVGDTPKQLVLTEARAMVVRKYLVDNFGFDDSLVKTLGMGKQTGNNVDTGLDMIQIFIFPSETKAVSDQK